MLKKKFVANFSKIWNIQQNNSARSLIYLLHLRIFNPIIIGR